MSRRRRGRLVNLVKREQAMTWHEFGVQVTSVQVAAGLIGCTERTVRSYCGSGRLKGAYQYGKGGDWAIPLESVLDEAGYKISDSREQDGTPLTMGS